MWNLCAVGSVGGSFGKSIRDVAKAECSFGRINMVGLVARLAFIAPCCQVKANLHETLPHSLLYGHWIRKNGPIGIHVYQDGKLKVKKIYVCHNR
jgi:hypothetical protein